MKKLLSLSSAKIYLASSLGLFMILGAFWHHQVNQTQLDRMNILNQGVGTCFNRVSQTFTAMMIKDIQSPYLNRGFMGLSDECLNETVKGINPFKQNIGKGYDLLNQLISEVHWFHEKVLKIHAPMLANQKLNIPVSPLADRFEKMESYKMSLVDEIASTNAQIRQIQMNDEILMGAGLIIFILSLSLLSLQEFNRMQLQREIERDALNLLKAGNANVGSMVDKLVDRALTTSQLPVSAQIFRDYHESILEKLASRSLVSPRANKKKEEVMTEEVQAMTTIDSDSGPMHKTSLKEILVSIQNLHSQNSIHSEVRDVQLNVAYETFEQMMNAAITQLVSRRVDNKKVMISNQIHSDKSVINLFLSGTTFSASELEFVESEAALSGDLDMNLVILKEMVGESGAQWHLENKVDRNGNITGMNIRFTVNRVPKESRKNLVSVVKGKKKDLVRDLMN